MVSPSKLHHRRKDEILEEIAEMIGAGPKRKKGTGLVQNATTTTSLGEMFATVVKHRSQEVAEASAATIEAETAEVVDIAEAVEDIVETTEAEIAVEVVVDIAEAEIAVEAVEDNAVTIAEGTIADRLDEGRANRVAGVQKARAGPADAEISRGAFI